ncbi:DUF6002 family protein [Streptomyces tsukubensis]|uniref:DUF6002 family protein n=1 Tax=Streptomyces tsukubensis TaxID=83656 RepID=UPI001180C221|nr:DUF6002 family protein [Streptomyces tsukubensis]QFR95902.1 hypothetical protein GBW32_26255 [Streptomyces tsukubensis]
MQVTTQVPMDEVELTNAIERYYSRIGPTLQLLLGEDAGRSPEFNPGPELPGMTSGIREFFSASGLHHASMGEYGGKRLALLNLALNPGTRTTKTFASLLTVARAVRFIQETGERVMILTPSSANKATAMRDAVLRALRLDLVTPEQLSVSVVIPQGSTSKLWDSELHRDPELQARNPVAVYPGTDPAGVKALARHVVDAYGSALKDAAGVNLWYTLDLNNYMAADVVRAFVESELFPPVAPRLHVHAVSSAYGLLGHAQGRALLDESTREHTPRPRYFLVQHLGAPDMVLSLYHGGTSRDLVPAYRYDDMTGLFEQRTDPRFPYLTADTSETLDTTFYTRNPPTSARMNELIHSHGGGGIVVSLHECLSRYAQVRALLRKARLELPADPRELREWSLVMAMTGLLNAVDRGLIDEEDVLVHGSGCYSVHDYSVLPHTALHLVENGDMLKDVVFKAAQA